MEIKLCANIKEKLVKGCGVEIIHGLLQRCKQERKNCLNFTNGTGLNDMKVNSIEATI